MGNDTLSLGIFLRVKLITAKTLFFSSMLYIHNPVPCQMLLFDFPKEIKPELCLLPACTVLVLRGNAFSKIPEIFGKRNTRFGLAFFLFLSI